MSIEEVRETEAYKKNQIGFDQQQKWLDLLIAETVETVQKGEKAKDTPMEITTEIFSAILNVGARAPETVVAMMLYRLAKLTMEEQKKIKTLSE